MLSTEQQEMFDDFFYRIRIKDTCLMSSEPRDIGKTTILNELAFTLQALGYIVYVLTPCKHQEYFAEKSITNNPNDIRGIANRDKLVVIADEIRYYSNLEFLDYCEHYKIPVVGFADFRNYKPRPEVDFKTEFTCEWN